jgi:hypothetical protein
MVFNIWSFSSILNSTERNVMESGCVSALRLGGRSHRRGPHLRFRTEAHSVSKSLWSLVFKTLDDERSPYKQQSWADVCNLNASCLREMLTAPQTTELPSYRPASNMSVAVSSPECSAKSSHKHLKDLLKVLNAPDVWGRQYWIKICFKITLRWYEILVILTTIQSRSFYLLVCCIKT